MDTTQKNREEAARRPREDRSREAQPKKQRPREQTAPQEAQRRPRPEQERNPQRPRQEAQREKSQAAPRERSREPQREKPRTQSQIREAPRQGEARGARSQSSARPGQEERTRKAPRPAQREEEPGQTQKRRREVPDDLSAKKRAYGKSKPRKKTVMDRMSDAFLKSMERNAAKKKAKEEAILRGASRSRKTSPVNIPAVIYTQPQAFNRSRLFVQLLTVTAVVLALVIGLSLFFKVGQIDVIGADVYTAWTVREASGINEGDNLLTFSRARAGALIKANLPYVKNVSFGIKLPDTVNIIIEEEDVVYSIQDVYSMWWLINSKGRVVEQTTAAQAGNHTQVLGINLLDPVPNDPAVASERQAVELPAETEASSEPTDPSAATETQPPSTISPVGTTGAEKLDAALKILKALEDNDIVGEAASVDVARIDDIMIWYGSRYQVKLGDSSQLEYKVACMNDVILQMSDYQSGILDISFTVWPDKVLYTPFS